MPRVGEVTTWNPVACSVVTSSHGAKAAAPSLSDVVAITVGLPPNPPPALQHILACLIQKKCVALSACAMPIPMADSGETTAVPTPSPVSGRPGAATHA